MYALTVLRTSNEALYSSLKVVENKAMAGDIQEQLLIKLMQSIL